MICRVAGRAERLGAKNVDHERPASSFRSEGFAPDFDRIPRRGPKNRLKTTNIHKLGWINDG